MMKKFCANVLKKWEYKKERKKKIQEFLKKHNLQLVERRETSIILGCFSSSPSKKGKGRKDLRDANGNVLDQNLTDIEVSNKMAAYTKAAKKEGIPVEEYLRRKVNKSRFGFDLFKFSNRLNDHLEYGHIRLQVVNNNLPARLPDGSPNPDRIEELYEYTVGKGGRTSSSLSSGLSFKVKSWGGSHFLKNIDNINVRIATPKNSLSGNIGTFKLPTGETVRKVQLEYYIKETNRWKLKEAPSTMWPKEWDINKVRSVIQEATENITKFDGNKFVGKTKDNLEIEFYIDNVTKEITTAYIKT